jgi:peptidoglycan hydrolase CwlO-like protein
MGECPLPSIPVVDFTEDELYGDVSQDEGLPEDCRAQVDESKRRLSKLFSNAKNDEQDVMDAEQRLGKAIADLEETLDKLYAEQENLELARACQADAQTAPEEANGGQDEPADGEEQQIVR